MDVDGWVRVLVTTPPELVDLASDACWEAGAAGIEERPIDGATEVIAGFASSALARAALAQLAALGLGGVLAPVDDDGLDAWREHAAAAAAPPFWLVPPWVEAPTGAEPGSVLWIDPGRTFGSGSHPTTRLVASQIASLVRPGDRVLDVGTGSGVLAIAAARAGAVQVVAIDVDERSPDVVRANAERNGVADVVHASTTALGDLDLGAGFDVVAANLLAPIIAELAPHLRAAVAPGGALVASGLLADRWEAGVGPLAPLAPTDVATDDGWAAIVLR